MTNAVDVVVVKVVSEDNRFKFLPSLFGSAFLLGESLVYGYMNAFAPLYKQGGGGFWEFLESDEKSVMYMRPATPAKSFPFSTPNLFSGDLSADAAGIVVTIYALNHLMHEIKNLLDGESLDNLLESLIDRYQSLLDYASQHDESESIYRAID